MKKFEPSQKPEELFKGVLVGTAVGDALGLPSENLSPEQIRKRWPGEWRMRLVFGRGMISDDTEHTLMVAQALLCHDEDAEAFQRSLSWKLRWWLLGFPGGVGFATARACLKMWIGIPPHRCGVNSGGAGPAMRSAILGAYFADAPQRRREFVMASSRLTHRGWQAETGALAVAECVAISSSCTGAPKTAQVLKMLRDLSAEKEWQTLVMRLEQSIIAQSSVAEFACILGLKSGVSGYALHVVPVAIFSWLRHPNDFKTALISVLECGGDTDTTGAILGAMAGATSGKKGMPEEWVSGLFEWPRSVSFMERIAQRLAEKKNGNSHAGQAPLFWPALIFRNLFFLSVVLLHGLRRLAPL